MYLYLPKKGNNIPNMGKKMIPRKAVPSAGVSDPAATYVVPRAGNALADALFTQTQQRVLGLLFGQPQRSFTVSEIIAVAGTGSGAAQRELVKLAASGLITVQPVGNQKRYQANPDSPVYEELVGIIQKTVGLAAPLRVALAPLAPDIVAAFVYGSVAKRSDTASSDIDLMIISDKLGFADVIMAMHPAQEQLGREINPTLYSRAELRKRMKDRNGFLVRVLAHPKIWLFGGEHDLGA